MSSKHIKALSGNISLDKRVAESDEEDVVAGITVASAFLALNDDSSSDSEGSCRCDSSESDDDESEDGENDIVSLRVKGNSTSSAATSTQEEAQTKDEADIQYLDSLLNTSSTTGSGTSRHLTFTQDHSFLFTDRRNLDIDAVMRRRFGGNTLQTTDEDEALPNRNNRKAHRNRRILASQNKKAAFLHRRLLFGAPKEEWPRPLSLLNGGMCMKMTRQNHPSDSQPPAAAFELHWSEDYRRQQEEFCGSVQRSGDANQLCLFLSRHPRHLGALLQLAVVFTRTGQMDRAADLVRRGLYLLEATHCEQFRPHQQHCHLDATREEDADYFMALFRHMQLCGALGSARVASGVGKVLLSLNPAGDPMHSLLFLDHFLLSCGSHEELAAFCSRGAGRVLLPACFSPPCESGDNSDGSASGGGSSASEAPPCILSEVLPNWAFSLALSRHLADKEGGNGAHLRPRSAHVLSPSPGAALSPSQQMLIAAVRRFPFMVPMSLAVGESEGDGRWKKVLGHLFFAAFGSHGSLSELVGSDNSETLCSLARLHRVKSGGDSASSVWRREGVQDWLLDSLLCLLEGLDEGGGRSTQEAIAESALSLERVCSIPCTGGVLRRYQQANEEDLREEMPRLPPDEAALVLDPRLAHPRVLAGEVQPPPLEGIGEIWGLQEGGNGNGIGERGNLDPRLPLLQLFLATLLPWNRLDLLV